MRLFFMPKKFVKSCAYVLVATQLWSGLPLGVQTSQAIDTDIFTAQSTAGATPNVLIVLDNTSNWSRQNQKWPGGIDQGQAEVRAIKNVLGQLPGSVNVGMLEYVTGGPATDNGGYVRMAVSPMGSAQGSAATTNRAKFSGILDTIDVNISAPNEKTSSSVSYGNFIYDAYNYFAGAAPFASSGDVVASLADSNGYTSNYTRFKSPLSAATSCGNNYIIMIANTASNGPSADAAANTAALAALGGNTTQMKLPVYAQTNQTVSTNLGYSAACYASQPTGTPTDYASQCPSANSTYNTCSFSTTDKTNVLTSCPSGQSRYSVIATTPAASSVTSVVTTTTNPGTTNSCYSASSNWTNADTGTVAACPANTSSTIGNITTATTYSCNYSVSNTAASSCAAVLTGPTVGAALTPAATASSTSCYSGLSTGSNKWTSSTDYGTLTCPANGSSTTGATTTNATYSCSYSGADGVTTGCTGSNKHIAVTQTAIPTFTSSTTQNKYPITQTVTKTVTTTTTSGSTQTTLGNTSACYASLGACATTDYSCPAGGTCACSATGATTTGFCPAGNRYQVLGNGTVSVEAPTSTFATDTKPLNSDEWARFMANKGVPVSGSINQLINTYTIDVYNAQPNAAQSGLLAGMARAGGGKYFTATNQQAIEDALKSIFAEIQAVNTTFASASLPISATNRAQNENQVYIGMFRPDVTEHPRWFGNLKRYQLGVFSGSTDLADVNNQQAVSSTTGFISSCAASAWTTDSGNYWYDTINDQPRIFITQATTAGTTWSTAGDDTRFAKGDALCNNPTFFPSFSIYSDLPDGATVEKGGAAQAIRSQGTRNIKTLSGTSLVDFNTTNVASLSGNSTVNANIVNFIRGQDVTGEIAGVGSTASRPSIHGDVIHSRPLPVNYGASNGVVVYYGANDGTFKAFSDKSKNELWSFVAPESFSTLQRLTDNAPLVQTPSPTPPGGTPMSGASTKEFFFDGSTGVYQNVDNSKVWIYTAMRRGGRMLYAFDVTDPSSPSYKWATKVGCPNPQGNDNGCTPGMSGIGQTWSTPSVAFLSGYSTTTPVVIVGGGYDICEDGDTASPSCSSPKGAVVYVLDGSTGALIKSFATDRSVASDISLVDINQDGLVDAAYVADTGGNLYRIDFSDTANGFTPVAKADWQIRKVAYTTGGARKFLFAPAVLPYKNTVYVTLSSGDREHPLAASYPYTSPVTNRFYTYLDDPLRTTATNLDGSTMSDYSVASNATCTAEKVLPGSSKKGWFMDLKASGQKGEQGVTASLIIGGMVAFSTNRPVGSGAICTTSLGEARGYWVNLLNGSGAIGVSGTCGGERSAILQGGGLAPSPVTGTVTINGQTKTIVIGAVKRGADGATPPTSSAISAQEVRPGTSSRRTKTYWRTGGDNR